MHDCGYNERGTEERSLKHRAAVNLPLTFEVSSHSAYFYSWIFLCCIFPLLSQIIKKINKRSRSNPHRRRWSTLSSGSGVPGNTRGSSPSPGSVGQVCLHVGMQVLLSSANEMAFIRYLGTADFAPGLWLGLELRSPKGKNDGSVGGRRYFTCRPGHGVLVRPSRVTYRGINGSRLVNESSWGLWARWRFWFSFYDVFSWSLKLPAPFCITRYFLIHVLRSLCSSRGGVSHSDKTTYQ